MVRLIILFVCPVFISSYVDEKFGRVINDALLPYLKMGILFNRLGNATIKDLIENKYAIINANKSITMDHREQSPWKVCEKLGETFVHACAGKNFSSCDARSFVLFKKAFDVYDLNDTVDVEEHLNFERRAIECSGGIAISLHYRKPRMLGEIYEMIDAGAFTNNRQIYRFRTLPPFALVLDGKVLFVDDCALNFRMSYPHLMHIVEHLTFTRGLFEICTPSKSRCVKSNFTECPTTSLPMNENFTYERTFGGSEIAVFPTKEGRIMLFEIQVPFMSGYLFDNYVVRGLDFRHRKSKATEDDKPLIGFLTESKIPDMTSKQLAALLAHGHEEEETLEALCQIVFGHSCAAETALNILKSIVLCLVVGTIGGFVVYLEMRRRNIDLNKKFRSISFGQIMQ